MDKTQQIDQLVRIARAKVGQASDVIHQMETLEPKHLQNQTLFLNFSTEVEMLLTSLNTAIGTLACRIKADIIEEERNDS